MIFHSEKIARSSSNLKLNITRFIIFVNIITMSVGKYQKGSNRILANIVVGCFIDCNSIFILINLLLYLAFTLSFHFAFY